MKFNMLQFLEAIDRFRSEVGGYSNSALIGVDVEVELVEENPGNGVLVPCLQLKCTKPVTNLANTDLSSMVDYTMEVFPNVEKQPPRLVKVITSQVKVKNTT